MALEEKAHNHTIPAYTIGIDQVAENYQAIGEIKDRRETFSSSCSRVAGSSMLLLDVYCVSALLVNVIHMLALSRRVLIVPLYKYVVLL